MARIIKFATKCGILGGAIYYSKQIGIWDSSEVTYELSKQGIAYFTPYINKLEKEVPITAEIKNLPSSDDVCRNVGTYWNKGVISSISFLEQLPSKVSCYIGQGISYVSSQLQQEKTSTSSEKENS